MAITTAMPSSFKVELLKGLHDFSNLADVIKVALIKPTPTGTYGAGSTNYSEITGNADEAVITNSGTGYTAGGFTLTNVTPTVDGTAGITDFNDAQWTLVEVGGTPVLAADGCMVYNTTNGNSACGLYDFGGTVTATGDTATFDIQWSLPAAATAVIRLA